MAADLERIKKMESALELCASAVEELSAQVERMEALKKKMTVLYRYYGSPAWYDDREAELPPELAAGVLSEDLVYDQITAVRDLAFRMLALGTDILKDRI